MTQSSQPYYLEHEDELTKFFHGSAICLTAIIVVEGYIFKSYMEACVRSDPKSKAQHFCKMSSGQQWSIYENLLAITHSVLVFILMLIGVFNCEGTFVTSDYCLNTPNIWLYRALLFCTAYFIVDLLVIIFLIGDHKAQMENYFHHTLGIAGACAGIFGGGYVTLIASTTLITELSTPFVNLRAILYNHEIKSGPVYMWNGIILTLMFFLARIVFPNWLVYYKMYPTF